MLGSTLGCSAETVYTLDAEYILSPAPRRAFLTWFPQLKPPFCFPAFEARDQGRSGCPACSRSSYMLSLTCIGSTGLFKISFNKAKSSPCIVVTSPSLKCELNRPALPAICRAWEVVIGSSSLSPFSLMLGFIRE